jgi:uncharacterized protein DUF4440
MNRSSVVALAALTFCVVGVARGQQPRSPDRDRQALVALENEWLNAHDSLTLNRILAPDFVHPVVSGDFLSKTEHVAWVVAHPRPADRRYTFGRLDVRLFGDVGIASGIVIASDLQGREIDRTSFTDVFVYREGRWQAVGAQETLVRQLPRP